MSKEELPAESAAFGKLQDSAKSGGPKLKPGKRPAGARKPEVKIPAVLLEGDFPTGPAVSGPGTRYALAPQPVAELPQVGARELPDAYGTGRVFLAARDPHWLYVSWDFTPQQQNRYNTQSRHGHLVIRIFSRDESKPSVPEVHVHPESRSWFVQVPYAATPYHVEIGFYDLPGDWRSVSLSRKTFTPPDAPSADISAKFATIPPEVTFQQVIEAVQEFVSVPQNQPLLEAVALASEAQRNAPSMRKESKIPRTSVTPIGNVSSLPRTTKSLKREIPIKIQPGEEWSEEQAGALTKLIHIDSFRRVWMGSMEITELVRRQLQEEISSVAAVEAKRALRGEHIPSGPFELNVSSPMGGEMPRERGFWFKVNAELVIYGATEPDAKVTIAGRLIKLRPDGTFSFRFSLPDGQYHLPVVAISRDGEEGREACLAVSRATEYRGNVEAQAQDPDLRPPHGENLG